MNVFSELVVMLLPKEPTFDPGTTSPTVPSPVTSERKISPGFPEFGRASVRAPAVAQWLDVEKRVPNGRSIVAPMPRSYPHSWHRRYDGPSIQNSFLHLEPLSDDRASDAAPCDL